MGQWDVVQQGSADINTIDFIDENIGLMAGDYGLLLRTEDGGINWYPIHINEDWDILKIKFYDDTLGWALARGDTSSNSNDSLEAETEYLILKSENGGSSWTIQNILEHYISEWSCFLYPVTNQILCLGDGGKVLKTDDGGTTWTVIFPEMQDIYFSSVWFIDEDIGITTGHYYNDITGYDGIIFITHDGGQNWEERLMPEFSSIENLQFIDDSTGFFLAMNDNREYLICKTTDTLSSWTEVSANENRIGFFRFIDSDLVFAAMMDTLGNNCIMESCDGGIRWEEKYSLPWELNSIHFSKNGTIGHALGKYSRRLLGLRSGSVYIRSLDSGNSWSIRNIYAYALNDVYVFDQNRIFIAGGNSGSHHSRGDIFATSDEGLTWNHVFHESKTVYDMVFLNDEIGFAFSRFWGCYIYKSVDGGTSWTKVFNGENWGGNDSISGNIEAFDMYFLNEDVGWLVGEYHSDSTFTAILSTTDGGENWDFEYKNYDKHIFLSIYCLDQNHRWAVGGSGLIAKHTVSAGWRTVDSPTDLPLRTVLFSDEKTGWIAGGYRGGRYEYQTIWLKSIDGGENWEELTGFNYLINDIFFINPDIGWAVGENEYRQGVILETKDGGENWMVHTDTLSAPLNAIHFKDGYGWAVGGRSSLEFSKTPSIILKTFDSGATWVNHETDEIYPTKFKLSQNHPNPFNPSTTINFTIPKSEIVKIDIYNTLGQRVKTILNKRVQAGEHEIEFEAKNLASGIYYYRIEAGDFQDVKKMILLK